MQGAVSSRFRVFETSFDRQLTSPTIKRLGTSKNETMEELKANQFDRDDERLSEGCFWCLFFVVRRSLFAFCVAYRLLSFVSSQLTFPSLSVYALLIMPLVASRALLKDKSATRADTTNDIMNPRQQVNSSNDSKLTNL